MDRVLSKAQTLEKEAQKKVDEMRGEVTFSRSKWVETQADAPDASDDLAAALPPEDLSSQPSM